METPDIASRIEQLLAESGYPPLICAYLYGSHGRAEAKPGSDVDLAVLPTEGIPRGPFGPLNQLRGTLERGLRREVDLVDLREAPVDLIHRVLRDGILVLEADAGARIAFEVDARNRYFDLLPHLERYRKAQEEA